MKRKEVFMKSNALESRRWTGINSRRCERQSMPDNFSTRLERLQRQGGVCLIFRGLPF